MPKEALKADLNTNRNIIILTNQKLNGAAIKLKSIFIVPAAYFPKVKLKTFDFFFSKKGMSIFFSTRSISHPPTISSEILSWSITVTERVNPFLIVLI